MATRKKYRFNGFGFPIVIRNVSTKETTEGEVMDINFNKLEKMLFSAIAEKPARLIGAELKFVRSHMDLTQAEFAELLGVERSSVAKWEKKDLAGTGMSAPTELAVRFHLLRFAKADLNTALVKVEGFTKKSVVGKPIEILVA